MWNDYFQCMVAVQRSSRRVPDARSASGARPYPWRKPTTVCRWIGKIRWCGGVTGGGEYEDTVVAQASLVPGGEPHWVLVVMDQFTRRRYPDSIARMQHHNLAG